MQGSLTVYFNTGFNGVDIPASPSVLENAQHRLYTNVYYTREDIDKPYFDVNDSYQNLKNVDYLAYNHGTETTYYFAVPTALSKGVTRLTCDLDALLTMGGAANLNYSGGWQERGHITKAEDTMCSNTASEDWIPSQPLEVAVQRTLGSKAGAGTLVVPDTDVVISSVDLSDLGDLQKGEWNIPVIEGIPTGETDPVMYFPAIPAVTGGTTYKCYDYSISDYKDFSVPGSAAFYYSENTIPVKVALKKLFSAGQLQLQASYRIPGEYLDQEGGANPTYVTGKPEMIEQVRGCRKDINADQFPFEYAVQDYAVKNKKCYSTYREFVLCNLGSSDCCIKTVEDLYNIEDPQVNPHVYIWADPSSTGKPYARFKYIRNNRVQYADAVKGLQWNNNQIMMQGASGSLWNSIDAAFNRSSLERQQGMANLNASYASQQASLGMQQAILSNQQQRLRGNLEIGREALGGLIGVASNDVAGAANSIGQMLGTIPTNLINNKMADDMLNLQSKLAYSHFQQGQANADNTIAQIQQAINENKIGEIRNNTLVAPTLLFTPEQNLGMYGYNYFVLYEVRKTVADLKSEDEYYQRFGYNGLHRPLTSSCFNARQYYSYVQAFNVNIKSSFGMRVRAKAISQLNQGVRVWKVLPDASYYDIN